MAKGKVIAPDECKIWPFTLPHWRNKTVCNRDRRPGAQWNSINLNTCAYCTGGTRDARFNQILKLHQAFVLVRCGTKTKQRSEENSFWGNQKNFKSVLRFCITNRSNCSSPTMWLLFLPVSQSCYSNQNFKDGITL